MAGLAPYWIVALWMLFATTLNVTFRWLQPRPALAAALGAVFGPVSYIAGAAVGVITSYSIHYTKLYELGADAETLHGEVGRAAREAGIHRLFATGPLSRAAVAGFGSGGRHFASHGELIDALGAELHGEMTVVITSYSIHYTKLYEESYLEPGGHGEMAVLFRCAFPFCSSRKAPMISLKPS